MQIRVDESKIQGKIKPMHACGGGPKSGGSKLPKDATEIFKEIGVPSCRLHDIEYAYGSDQFIDIHCIFPNFDADENDENSYNFLATDAYLLAIKNSGAEVYYRLGESIDHFKKKLYIHPPKDNLKWAKICEHIILHYNEGWANGYHLGIKYWEIWNEPVGDCMWSGTPEQFYELYTVASKYLKSKFPSLKIGGYSCVGFYYAFRDRSTDYVEDLFDSVKPFFENFFEYIKDKDVPLDFFSWHSYTLSPEEVVLAGNYIRNYLDERGYTHTESHLTELNMFYVFGEKTLYQHPEFSADLLGIYIEGQYSSIDMIFYYDLRLSQYNAMFYYDILDKQIKRLPALNAMKFFGNLYRLGSQIEVDYKKGEGLYALGATDGKSVGIAISSRSYQGETQIALGAEKVTVYEMNGNSPVTETVAFVKDGKITLSLKTESIYYIKY